MSLQRKTPLRAKPLVAERPCVCGCGTLVGLTKRGNVQRYVKGHNAKRLPTPRFCTVCEAPLEYRQGSKHKTSSRACESEAKARAKIGALNPNFKGAESYKARQARWDACRGLCARCGSSGTGQGIHQHHVVYRQEVMRRGGDIWDVRNGVTLCLPCHTSHHHQSERRLLLTQLPDAAFGYAAELLGAGPAYEYLRRRYGGNDERLDGLLVEWESAA